MHCIGCNQARETFSATMAHAHFSKRLCFDCEKKFGVVPPPQIQQQVQRTQQHYSPSLSRSVVDMMSPSVPLSNNGQASATNGGRISPSSLQAQQILAAQQQKAVNAYDVAVDVGGTNTDVVLLSRDAKDSDQIKVVEICKEPTTVDITTGIVKGVRHVLASAAVPADSVRFVFLGTTTFTNALVERSADLARVSVLRLGGSGVKSIKPFSTLPQDLQRRVAGDFEIVDGGYDLYGSPYLPLDVLAVRSFCNRLRMNNGPFNIVINGCFSSIRADQEEEVERIVRSELSQMIGPDRVEREVVITKASDIAGSDLLLREHAAICNAALRPLALKVIAAFYTAFHSSVLPLHSAKIFLTQNDGTIMKLTDAAKKPILTIGSGPTNSLVGATVLAKTQGLLPASAQGNLSFDIVAATLPLLQRTRHVAGYQYNPYEAPELHKIKERIVVKLGKAPPNEEEKRNCAALGFYHFAPNGQMNSDSFVRFMITSVKCKLSAAELKDLFNTLDVGGTKVLCCDIGGTTSDLGIVERSGFPRVSNVTHTTAGVKLNSRGPDTVSIGLGGGSHCTQRGPKLFTFGPQSVGYNLTSNRYGAKCFGGPNLTATDVAVALGHCQIPGADSTRTRNSFQRLDDAKVALETMKAMLEEQISLVKTDAEDLPLLLVGGGACLFPQSIHFAGTKEKIIRPQHHDVANAVGAAVARVGADLDEMVAVKNFPPTPNNSSEELIETQFKAKLIQKCASSGALHDTVVITNWSLESLGFLPGVMRVTGRAMGKMDIERIGSSESQSELNSLLLSAEPLRQQEQQKNGREEDYSEGEYVQQDHRHTGLSDSFLSINREVSPRPANINNGVWTLTPEDVELVVLGASVLGCGGGGNPYQGRWRVLNQIVQEGKQVRVISPRALDKQRHVVFPLAFAGAPTVLIETIGSGDELSSALHNNIALCERQVQGRQVVIMSGEIGGTNGVEPMVCAAKEGCYILDADGMGRAFPYLRHSLPLHAPGAALAPFSMSGARDAVRPSVIRETSFEKIESQVREQLMSKHSGICGLAFPPLTVEQCAPEHICHGSISLAHRIGAAIHNARVHHADPVRHIVELLGGKVIFVGIIAGNERVEKKGFSAGTLLVRGGAGGSGGSDSSSSSSSLTMKINYINENIAASVNGTFVATTPDCISVLDVDSGEAIFCDQYKFGVRVAVVAFPCHAAYRSGTPLHETMPRKLDKDLNTDPVLMLQARPAVVSYCDQQ